MSKVIGTQWTLTLCVNGLKKRARYWGNHTMRLGTFEGTERPPFTDDMHAQIDKWVRAHMKDWRNITLWYRREEVVRYGDDPTFDMIEYRPFDEGSNVSVPVFLAETKGK